MPSSSRPLDPPHGARRRLGRELNAPLHANTRGATDRYLETDVVDYDLDTDDEAWLDSYNSTASAGEVSHALNKDKFEQLMDRLERATPDEVCFLNALV